MPARTLADVVPEFAAEMEQVLRDQGEPDLAEQIGTLFLVDPCPCGDPTCATFYTAPRPVGRWPPSVTTVMVDAERGMINLDVDDGVIRCVEILNRPDVRSLVLAALA